MSSVRFVLVYLVIAGLAAVQSCGRAELDPKALRQACLSHVANTAN